MKKVFILVGAIFVLAGSVSHSASQDSAIGLFTDKSHALNYISVETMEEFELYVWVKPGAEGFKAADFLIEYPSNALIIETTILNDVPSIGNTETGIAVAFGDCVTDWVPILRQKIYMTSSKKSVFAIGGQENYDSKAVYCDCTEGYPIYDLDIITGLYVNFPAEEIPALDADESSWGAVKGLYRD